MRNIWNFLFMFYVLYTNTYERIFIMKKIITAFSFICLSLLLLISCNNKNNSDVQNEKEFNYTTQEILQNIIDKMGESYLPNVDMDENVLSQKFGIDMADVEEFSAQEPMIGFHPDKAVIIKAKDGSADKIEEAFVKAKERMVSDAMQYPTNIHKTNEATIVRHGNYVAFLLLGPPDDGSETDEEAIEFAKSQVKVAVDAFNEMFK